MPRSRYILSGYRGMWLFAMFDLPVTTEAARRRYVRFRNDLLKEGFSMMQYSVYARYCGSEELGDALFLRIRAKLPTEGHVRFLMVTDRQFGKMRVFHGKKAARPENAPEQLLLF